MWQIMVIQHFSLESTIKIQSLTLSLEVKKLTIKCLALFVINSVHFFACTFQY